MSKHEHVNYTKEQLDAMSNEELARLGTELDDVTVAFRKERFPIPNDPAEKRSAILIGTYFTLGLILALAFLGIYLFWPWEYKYLGQEGLWTYSLYTPLLGVTLGLAIFFLGVGAVLYVKRFIPQEVSVQKRHDGPSAEVDRQTLVALLNDSWTTSMIGRRKIVGGLLGAGAVVAGLAIMAPLGGMIKNPWKPGKLGIQGDGTLWTSGWTLADTGVKIYLGRDTGALAQEHDGHMSTAGISRLVRMRPGDLSAAAMETVYPLTPDIVNDGDQYDPQKDVYSEQLHSIHGPRNPVMLIRLRSADAARVVERKGQETFHYGDLYAYSKICTHIGCPTSLFEAQENRILCPCHQSQFDVLRYCRPIFGPAARALPQLPITVDEEGFLIAKANFIEPLGPSFWERTS